MNTTPLYLFLPATSAALFWPEERPYSQCPISNPDICSSQALDLFHIMTIIDASISALWILTLYLQIKL